MFAPILLPGVPWLPAPMAEMVPSMPRLPISPTARGSEKARGGCALRLDGRLARGSPTTCCILLMFLLLSTCAPIVPNLSGRVCVYVGVACYYNCVGKGHTWRAEGGTHTEACTKACVGSEVSRRVLFLAERECCALPDVPVEPRPTKVCEAYRIHGGEVSLGEWAAPPAARAGGCSALPAASCSGVNCRT